MFNLFSMYNTMQSCCFQITLDKYKHDVECNYFLHFCNVQPFQYVQCNAIICFQITTHRYKYGVNLYYFLYFLNVQPFHYVQYNHDASKARHINTNMMSNVITFHISSIYKISVCTMQCNHVPSKSRHINTNVMSNVTTFYISSIYKISVCTMQCNHVPSKSPHIYADMILSNVTTNSVQCSVIVLLPNHQT
jgi:hypothetical protein